MSNKLYSQPPQWMVVYVTHNAPEAYIVAGRLESEGIRAMVHQVPGASALGIHIGSLGEITVLVREADYSSAILILDPDSPDLLMDSTDDMTYLEFDDDE